MQALHLKEYSHGVADNKVIIIFDEGKYFVYGTRRQLDVKSSKYEDYYYEYSEQHRLVNFLKFLTDMPRSLFTAELHNIVIPDEDLDYVDFNYLNDQFTPFTVLVAYDEVKLNKKELQNILGFLC